MIRGSKMTVESSEFVARGYELYVIDKCNYDTLVPRKWVVA
jgi:hypothetical protein